jgi:GNAT superfamily N-acetyltransferase
MTEPQLLLTDAPDATARALIEEGLAGYNEEQTGLSDRRPLAVLVRDPATGAIAGGLVGRTTLGIFFLDLFFLPQSLRGRALGSRILGMAEEEARRRGCWSAALVTISFQAPEFYARHGWRELGRVPCKPPGSFRIFMAKDFARS